MKKVLLTTENSTRTKKTSEHLLSHDFDCEIFYAIKHEDAKISFNLSMQEITRNCDDTLWFFEDDVVLKDSSHLLRSIIDLPPDWEILYLGANLVGPIEKYSDNLYRTYAAWTTHAVMFKNAKKVCEGYDDTSQMFDDWLKENVHPRGNSYIVAPMIAWQMPHISQLWNHYADYTEILNASANKLV